MATLQDILSGNFPAAQRYAEGYAQMPSYLQDPYLGLSTSNIGKVTQGLLNKAPEVVDNAKGLLQSSTKLAPELKQPFIGYMTKDGFTEMFNHEAAKLADYHHSHLMKDPDKYLDDNALSFVRMGGENVFTVKGNAILDPYKKDSSKQLGILAKKLINEGADPQAPFYVEDLALPKIEAPYQGKQIGTLQDWLKYTK